MATATGALGTLAPLAGAGAVAVFVAAVAITRYVSLGSIAGAASLPAFVALVPSRWAGPAQASRRCWSPPPWSPPW